MEFFIISGLSGAGKSRVANILEDLDFYCVDNMPVVLMPIFAELCLATKGRYDKVALVTDIRDRDGAAYISEITDRYIKHPSEVLSVGDVVHVRIKSVDPVKKRVALTMKAPKA